MLVYEGIKSGFIDDVDLNKITDKIYNRFREIFHRGVNESEINSWRESMLRMRGVLADSDIPNNVGVAIEFNIPHTSNRIDFLISGYDSNSNNSIIIIELKQWTTCTAIEGKDGIVSTVTGRALREVPHPSYQAWSYSSLINCYNQDIYDENIGLYPCAFLHNYDLKEDDPIYSEQYQEYIEEAPMFGSKDFEKLRNFIKRYIIEGDNKEGLYKIENGKIRPSKMLQDSFASLLKGNKEFVLIDDQKVIYEEAIRIGINNHLNNEKNVLIVEGGPGTGKSVLAINLLQKFLSRDFNTFYVTKNSAPREVFKAKLKINKLSGMNNLFKSSGNFIDCESNAFDVLIVDEAHRLNAKSGLFSNLGEDQIKEIINASKFSIFFIDENQRVTLKDIGSINHIKKCAKELNAGIHKMDLKSQFRCDGSDGYLAWLDNVLEIKETANFDLDSKYDFKVFDNPNELRDVIFDINKKNNKSRLVAGYCWNWISEGKNNSEIHDITIPEYNFAMSWNLGNTSTYAIDPESINQIGCIHTCQGLEFDYVGVIIGDDIRYEDGHVVTDYTKRAKTDQSLKGIKKISIEQGEEVAKKIADIIIKNTYKTLMTRGMKGCYVYCVDEGMRDYLKQYFLNINSRI
ncbi:MAG: DUF2075 domain-containing protein [Bacilli bacterium]|nr:DUF2075 domain-containing protein [Bacilli bacterium]